MNKLLINTLSIILAIILAVYTVLPIVLIGGGLPSISSQSADSSILNSTPVQVLLTKDNNKFSPDSRLELQDGSSYPMFTESATILVPDSKFPNHTLGGVDIAIGALTLIVFIFLLIYLGKFIISINKGRIFVRENSKRLNSISICLLIMAFLSVISGIVTYTMFSSLNIKGATLDVSPNWEIPWTNLLLGFITMLIAQTWKRGIMLREDQEMTI